MQIVENYLEKLQARKAANQTIRNQRQFEIKRFLERINEARRRGGYKEYQPRTVGVLLRNYKTGDLDAFYKECDRKKDFYRYFSWKLKQ